MVLCSKCKKRPAIVFLTTMNGTEKRNEGYCLACAKALNIPQVAEYMEHMGITDEDVEAMSDQMMDLMRDESFEPGGAGTLPNFIQNLFAADQSKSEPAAEAGEAAGSGEPQESSRRPERHREHSKREKKKESKYLSSYCTDLTQKAQDGTLDRIIGREREITRAVQILSRRQKNNPCLIGEPGVGKTAIAEGIALHIVEGKVPYHLRHKRVMLLDMTALVAGTQFRGQFESRIKGLTQEVKEAGNIILRKSGANSSSTPRCGKRPSRRSRAGAIAARYAAAPTRTIPTWYSAIARNARAITNTARIIFILTSMLPAAEWIQGRRKTARGISAVSREEALFFQDQEDIRDEENKNYLHIRSQR